jgi:thioredoxin-like negative regulator of GroEL
MDIMGTLNQAIAAAQSGRKAEARRLLEAVLDADERNEQAWLWLSNVVESNEERVICLENMLTINPDNDIARQALTVLQVETASSSQVAGVSRPPALGPAPHAEPPKGEALPDRSHLTDNRAFVLITIILALMLICTVLGILAFVILSPPG